MASNRITWHLKLNVKPGKQETLRALCAEMSKATASNEPGTLIYEWYISPDGTSCHIIESYADSAAAMVHIATFGEKYAERFLDCLEPTGLAVYGNPSEEVRSALAGHGAVHLGELGGFRR
ncbi:MAG: antibiotic biosynthesis monooxygenase [Opitutaceae bacterium]